MAAAKHLQQKKAHRAACTSAWTSLATACFALAPWVGDAPALFSTLLASGLQGDTPHQSQSTAIWHESG